MTHPPRPIGLVLAGGRSTRMRTDKALLPYHGIPQYLSAIQLLAPRCTSVYVSCQEDQAAQFDHPTLPDAYPDQGPLGGIVTAMQRHHNSALWVVACDLPLLDAATLDALAAARDMRAAATVIQSPAGHLEPLCSLWESAYFERITAAFAHGERSVQRLLRQLPHRAVPWPGATTSLFNANTPQEREAAFRRMQDQRNTPKNNS